MDDRPIRILFILPSLTAGGAERVVLTLLRNLCRSKFDAALLIVSNDDAVLLDEVPPDIRVFELNAQRLRRGLAKIVKHLWRHKPDIVFSTLDYLNVALGFTRPFWPRHVRLIARPTILFSADLPKHRMPSSWRAINKFVLPYIDLMVFQSEAMEQDYCNSLNWHSGLTTVIHNPIDFSFIQKQISQPTNTGFDPTKFNFVAAGRLEEQKGFDIAIEAIALTRNANINLTVLGEGSERQALESLINKLKLQNRVNLLGYINNPYPYFAQADGFLLSSRLEGFPNVVLEALACRTAVVATPVAGIEKFLEGIPGCHLSADSTPAGLAKAIDLFVGQGPCRVSRVVVESFHVKHIVAQYEQAFVESHRPGYRHRIQMQIKGANIFKGLKPNSPSDQ
jgi:glycosyltransferase involved in cell wall biosynthesis